MQRGLQPLIIPLSLPHSRKLSISNTRGIGELCSIFELSIELS